MVNSRETQLTELSRIRHNPRFAKLISMAELKFLKNVKYANSDTGTYFEVGLHEDQKGKKTVPALIMERELNQTFLQNAQRYDGITALPEVRAAKERNRTMIESVTAAGKDFSFADLIPMFMSGNLMGGNNANTVSLDFETSDPDVSQDEKCVTLKLEVSKIVSLKDSLKDPNVMKVITKLIGDNVSFGGPNTADSKRNAGLPNPKVDYKM